MKLYKLPANNCESLFGTPMERKQVDDVVIISHILCDVFFVIYHLIDLFYFQFFIIN